MRNNVATRPVAFSRLVYLIFAAASWPSSDGAAVEQVYQVGVAKVDVTPDYPVRLNGFGSRREESEGVTQRVWAKALAIGTDEERPLVLVTLDNLGIPLSMTDDVAARLKATASIDRDRFAVTFTHTHTAPKVNGASDTIFSSPIPAEHQEHIDQYTKDLADAMEQAALAALAGRRPAVLAWSVGKVGFAKNRRPQGGHVDHDLPLLVVKSPDDGTVRAILASYACHCVTLSHNKISGDWAGYAQAAIERNHPGVVALMAIGCGSDANPDSGVTGDNTAAAADQGDQIATEVDRLLKTQLKPISGAIQTQLHNLKLPLKPTPPRQELEALAAKNGWGSYNAQWQLDKLNRGEKLLTEIEYPIQTWSFGDSLSMVFLAGEVCADYSLRLKSELDASRLWINGYSNYFCGYIPSERLLREGGYGGGEESVYFAWPTTLAPGMEEPIIREVHRQVPPAFHRDETDAQDSNANSADATSGLWQMQVEDGLVVELVAAEPLVADPVAIDFGPDGRVWVAEMTDYSHEVDDKFKQSGKVTALADRDGDGKIDEAKVFEDGLRFPTDVKVWGKGVIVCDAPDVIYLEDANGDGRADARKVLLTGFGTQNPQARVNSLRWGLDNWLYGSGGLMGGRVKSFGGQEIELGNSDFRFRPETGEVEAVTGSTQQGRARDDWGNWFGCANSNLLKHYPLTNHYLARNPHVAATAVETYPPFGPDHDRLYPIGELSLYKLSGPPGRPTSVCGLDIYRDELLGLGFAGNAFVAEPVNRIVHRMKLEPHGATFRAVHAGREAAEFLASSEPWFRPVQVRTGLDGCLWIVDMHRAVIEHKRFIPAETLRTIDLMAGNAQGRIYRVRPRETPPRAIPHFDKLSVAELVAALDSPNGPQRDLVHQMLVQRHAREAAPALTALATSANRPVVRMQTLGTLDGLGAVTKEMVSHAIADPDPGVRRHAVRLAEPFLHTNDELAAAVIHLISDDDPQVRLQVAYTLGELPDAGAADALVSLARRRHTDPHVLSAVWSSVTKENVGSIVHALLSPPAGEDLPASFVDPLVALVINLGDDACVADVLRALENNAGAISESRLEMAARVLESLAPERRRELAQDNAHIRDGINQAVDLARKLLDGGSESQLQTLAAARILAACSPDAEEAQDLMRPLLAPQNAPAVQRAAIEVLGAMDAPRAADILLEAWPGYTPELRSQVLDVLVARPALLPSLVEKLASGEVAPVQIDALHRQQLLTHADAEIRSGAAKAFAGAIDEDRQKIVDEYAAALHQPGDAARGRKLFADHCANCHKLGDLGHEVGPDLAALTNRSPLTLLESIFDPNRALDERYQSYAAFTDDGLAHTGILIRETANSITLKGQQAKEETILRKQIEELKNSGVSLMPLGFEKELSPEGAADLLSYLAAEGAPPKQLPGNVPKIVEADGDGALWLVAANAAIFGGEITFELPWQNIGYWHGQSDCVAWDVEVDQADEYEAYLHWACTAEGAGGAAIIEGFASPLRIKIENTGGFEHYRTKPMGRIQLPAGRSRIVVRPDGPLVAHYLMDLRGIYLVPEGGAHERARAGDPPAQLADAADAITELLQGLAVGTEQEYERIPAIWEQAIAAGRRDESAELVRLLELSLPKPDGALQHWQAVVIGGGIINGLSQQRVWPRARLLELIQNDGALLKRWERLIELSKSMADEESVKTGTRYDALRILGADVVERSGPTLVRYLGPSVHSELHMGAISGLSDIDDPAAASAIIDAFANFDAGNQARALDALMRTQQRIILLLDAVEAKRILPDAFTAEQIARLKQLESDSLRQRAAKLF